MKRISRRRFMTYSGAVYPLTGALARIGAAIKNGIELAVDIVNNPHPDLSLPLAATSGLPKLGNRKIRVVWGDTRGDPATGRAEAERQIERERVVALIGSYQSAVTATASLAAEAKGIPYLNPESSSPRLTDRGFKWFFRTGPHDITFTKLFFDMMEELRDRGQRLSRVAILSEDTEFGATAAGVAKGYAAVYKHNVVEVYRIIHDLRRRGIALLIVEQNARTALRNADRAYVLEQGQVRFEGSGEEILHDPEVQRAYLGS